MCVIDVNCCIKYVDRSISGAVYLTWELQDA